MLIIYYDDRCSVCSAVIRMYFIQQSDSILLRSIWTASGLEWARVAQISPDESIIVLDSVGVHTKSRAFAVMLRACNRSMQAALLDSFPRYVSDYIYGWLGARRYLLQKWFGVCSRQAVSTAEHSNIDSDILIVCGSARSFRRNIDGGLAFVCIDLLFPSAAAMVNSDEGHQMKVLGLPTELASALIKAAQGQK
jgi:predicted DCC family thiol-disulfide oxidoreductase YuxK